LETDETFAVKKILIDPTFKSRELELLQSFTHPNIINLRDHFFETSQDNPIDEKYLNIVSDFYPETLCHVMNFFRVEMKKVCVPHLLTKMYMF
jgi:kinase